jgi:ABC-type xylose transport system substrate-binding protein
LAQLEAVGLVGDLPIHGQDSEEESSCGCILSPP